MCLKEKCFLWSNSRGLDHFLSHCLHGGPVLSLMALLPIGIERPGLFCVLWSSWSLVLQITSGVSMGIYDHPRQTESGLYIQGVSFLTLCRPFLVWFMCYVEKVILYRLYHWQSSYSVKKANCRYHSTSLCALNRCRSFAFLSNVGKSAGLERSSDQLGHFALLWSVQ